MIRELKKPLIVGGEEIKEVSIDFSGVNGEQMMKWKTDYERLVNGGEPILMMSDNNFHIYVAADLAKLPFETVMKEMAPADFMAIMYTVQGFFITGEERVK